MSSKFVCFSSAILYIKLDMTVGEHDSVLDVPTCVCVRPNEAASSARSGRAKYCVF